MRGKNLLDRMDLVDPSFIEAADEVPQNKKRIFAKYGMLAACLAVIISAVGVPVFYYRNSDSKVYPMTGDNGEQQIAFGVSENEKPSDALYDGQADENSQGAYKSELPDEGDVLSEDGFNEKPASDKEGVTEHSASILAAPDYEFQLHRSDDVILGEVIDELDGYYCNPDYEIKELGNMWITPYVVRIDESYRGKYSKGGKVLVTAWNNYKPEDKDPNVWIEDDYPFYLHEGQRAVFMLDDCSEYLSIDGWDTVYEVVMQPEGVFEPKGTNEEGKEIYASPSFEVTLDSISDDIKKADEKYGESDSEE